MATHIRIMPFNTTEPAPAFTHTAISWSFSQLLGTLAAHIEAERDIEDAAWFDPAFMSWQREAERVRDRVLSLSTSIRRALVARAEDSPLKRMAYVAFLMVQSPSTKDFQRARDFYEENIDLFSCPGFSVTATRVQQMLFTARMRFDELASLDSYFDPLDAKHHPAEDEADTPMGSVA